LKFDANIGIAVGAIVTTIIMVILFKMEAGI